MTDIIKLLPDNIANQIAAGEVVQRPASVVKELLENAIDAKSTNITFIIREAGKQLIQVIDNGSGMSFTDSRMCFERHATSKIKNIDDLYAINTLGFRGEAMASIAAVAQVELKTKRAIDELGTLLQIDNNITRLHELTAYPEGTNISVKNLFFNVPARKNFLKSNLVEYNHIRDEFIRVCLANPNIKFSFINEDEEIYHLPSGNLKQRIAGVFGKKMEEYLLPIEEITDVVRISGFIGKPEAAKKNRNEQFFFANNRFIKSNYLNYAITQAFLGLISTENFPSFFIFLEINPAKIDINVHPTKTEIKFENEKVIYALLNSAIKKVLNQFQAAPTLSFDNDAVFSGFGAFANPEKNENILSTGFDRNPNLSSFNFDANYPKKASANNWETIYQVLSSQTEEDAEEPEINSDILEFKKASFQLHNQYIITSLKSGMLIVHQQFAHERILYERYFKIGEEKDTKIPIQKLLFPELIQLNLNEIQLIKSYLEEINKLGIMIEEFGKDALIVNGLPLDFDINQLPSFIGKIIQNLSENMEDLKLVKHNHYIALSLAQSNSYKQGMALSQEVMSSLIDELFGCSEPYFSPLGKPTMITISTSELAKKFKI